MHQKYGMTHQQLVELGAEISNRNIFRMSPYFAYITVVTDRKQWDAVTTWLVANGGPENVLTYGDDYESAAGYALRCHHRGNEYCLLGVHRSQLTDFSPVGLHQFINILSHEIQHCVTYLNEKLGINTWREEEPHAYLSGSILESALGIIARDWRVNFIGVPHSYNAAISGARRLPPTISSNLTTLSALSGMIDATIAKENNVVWYGDFGWTSATFFTGGKS